MYLDYSKIAFDPEGRVEQPELMLQTKGGRRYGTIPGVSSLKLNIKLSEPSEISFDVSSCLDDGTANPMYERVVGHRIVFTERYGIYVLSEPEEKSDGLMASKNVRGYSLEKELDNKKFFLEEGTFNFYDPSNIGDTIIGRILEIAAGWSVGYVSASLIGRYRTFDEYNGNLLTLMYGDIAEKFRCVFVFDPYAKTVNVYDADEERTVLPIYLDFDNLVEELRVKELTTELVTALRPSGSDGLNVIDVNPTGSQWVYDLSYFVENGDIADDLAAKYLTWQRAVVNNRELYKAVVALRTSAKANLAMKEAELTDLDGELSNLINQQSVAVQQQANEITDAGYIYQQQVLDEINRNITAKRNQISAKQSEINTLTTQAEAYQDRIDAIVDTLSFENYFTTAEQEELSRYCIEEDLADDTFVATGFMDTQDSMEVSANGATVSVSGSSVQRVTVSEFGKTIYMLAGGKFAIASSAGASLLSGDLIRGTLEVSSGNSFVFSFFTGAMTNGDTVADSGTVTISGTASGITSDVHAVVEQDVTEYIGTWVRNAVTSGNIYVTFSVSDFQKYTVASELYDYAVEVLADKAVPTYEFSVGSGNFLFAQEFAPFRNALELGKAVHLRVSDTLVITPIAIEMSLNFDDESDFSLLFSNRFKRHDAVNTLKDVIQQSYSSSRSFDVNKYLYNQTTKQTDAVTEFLRSSLDAAANAIKAAKDQNVTIDGTGIRINSLNSASHPVELRLTDGMIAMSDDNWEHAKLAIGYFQPVQGKYSTRSGSDDSKLGAYFGVNAEVLGGRIVLTNNLILENPKLDANGNYTGTMMFRADSTGVWLNNSTFVLQSSKGGRLVIDPDYGLLAGTTGLFTTDGDSVIPSFINSSGDVVLQSDGMPKNTNFYIDARNGNAYFRGTVYASAGTFAGELKAATGTFSGDISAASGTFKGTIQASRFLDANGNNMMSNSGKWKGDYIESLTADKITAGTIDANTVTIQNLIVGNNVAMGPNAYISWGNVTGTSGVTNGIANAQSAANTAQSTANSAKSIAEQIAAGTYTGGTFIDGKKIYSPTVYANQFNVMPETLNNQSGGYSIYGYYGTRLFNFFSISYYGQDTPYINFDSPGGAYANWRFSNTYFSGNVYFDSANVYGLQAQFG